MKPLIDERVSKIVCLSISFLKSFAFLNSSVYQWSLAHVFLHPWRKKKRAVYRAILVVISNQSPFTRSHSSSFIHPTCSAYQLDAFQFGPDCLSGGFLLRVSRDKFAFLRPVSQIQRKAQSQSITVISSSSWVSYITKQLQKGSHI